MSPKKIFLILFSGICLAAGPSWPAGDSTPSQATFSSVTGQVTLQGPNSKKKRPVYPNSTAQEGDRVATGKDSSATLVLFDGSQLEIGAESSLVLSRLQKPSPLEKIFKLKLLVGELLAKVQKLTSSKSSFEIEAGGVVCGVRGTVYQMAYQPQAQTVDLKVLEGTVFTQVNGGTPANYTAGQTMHFTHVLNSNPKGSGTLAKGTGKGEPGKSVNTNQGSGVEEPGKSVNTNQGSGVEEPGKSVNTNQGSGVEEPGKSVNTHQGSGGDAKGGKSDPSNYGHGGNSGNNTTGSSTLNNGNGTSSNGSGTADITLAGGLPGNPNASIILPSAGGLTLTSPQPATITFNPSLMVSNPGLPGGAVTLTMGAPPTITFNTGVTLTGVQVVTGTPSNPIAGVVTFNPTFTGANGGVSFITITNPGGATSPSLTFTVATGVPNGGIPNGGVIILNSTNPNSLTLNTTYQVTSGKPSPGAANPSFTITVNGPTTTPPITFTVAGGNPGAPNSGAPGSPLTITATSFTPNAGITFVTFTNPGTSNPGLTFTVAGAPNPTGPITFTGTSPATLTLNPGFTVTNLGPTSATFTVVTTNPVPTVNNLDNPALTALNSTFLQGVLVNADNNLNLANRQQAVLLVVP